MLVSLARKPVEGLVFSGRTRSCDCKQGGLRPAGDHNVFWFLWGRGTGGVGGWRGGYDRCSNHAQMVFTVFMPGHTRCCKRMLDVCRSADVQRFFLFAFYKAYCSKLVDVSAQTRCHTFSGLLCKHAQDTAAYRVVAPLYNLNLRHLSRSSPGKGFEFLLSALNPDHARSFLQYSGLHY